jgi:opacity protein-like surface antigen
MHWKLSFSLTLSVLLVCVVFPACAQSVPAAIGQSGFSPLAVGIGFSGYNPDYDHGHLLGSTLWIDYTPDFLPTSLRGLGVEMEARDLNYGRSTTQPPNLRQDVGAGGVLYSMPHFHGFRPYTKFLMGLGNTDETAKTGVRYNDSRTVTIVGGGIDFRAIRKVWVRADYEYQFWPDFFKHANKAIPAGVLNPQGFTLGAVYHF